MIDSNHVLASYFLWAAGGLFLVVFALPILFAPLAWAKVFQWKLPERTELTVYFGRCLGAVATAVVVVCFRAAPRPQENKLLFELILVAAVLLTAIHIWGAIRREQPWTETVEIALYGGLALLTAWIYSGL